MIYVLLATGFEEIEALTPVDLLRRAGLQVQTVGVSGTVVTGAHGIPVTADISIDSLSIDEDAQAVILPGGQPGTDNLELSIQVKQSIQQAYDGGKIVAAICAAPSILAKMGLLDGKKATVFPAYAHFLVNPRTDSALVDGTIVTGKSAGHAIDFALTLIEQLKDRETAEKISASIYYQS